MSSYTRIGMTEAVRMASLVVVSVGMSWNPPLVEFSRDSSQSGPRLYPPPGRRSGAPRHCSVLALLGGPDNVGPFVQSFDLFQCGPLRYIPCGGMAMEPGACGAGRGEAGVRHALG